MTTEFRYQSFTNPAYEVDVITDENVAGFLPQSDKTIHGVLCGLYRARRTLGQSVLDAYRDTLLVSALELPEVAVTEIKPCRYGCNTLE